MRKPTIASMPKKKGDKGGRGSRSTAKRRIARPKSGRPGVTRVPKPWGYEIIWARTERYVGKILHINAGHELSVQYHKGMAGRRGLGDRRHAHSPPHR